MSFIEVLILMGIIVILSAIGLHVIFLDRIHRNSKASPRSLGVLWVSIIGAPIFTLLVTQLTTVLAVGIVAGFLWLTVGLYRALGLLTAVNSKFVVKHALIALFLGTLLSFALAFVYSLIFFSNFSFEL